MICVASGALSMKPLGAMFAQFGVNNVNRNINECTYLIHDKIVVSARFIAIWQQHRYSLQSL